jgi:hypothetical protein
MEMMRGNEDVQEKAAHNYLGQSIAAGVMVVVHSAIKASH